MKTILRILERAGGYRPTLYLKIENPPFMALVIEAMPEPGPTGLPAISIAHYCEQNGDLMRDPEMCFELVKSPQGELSLSSFYFRNDYLGIKQYSRYASEHDCIVLSDLHREHEQFARMWDRNIHAQGFDDAFNDKSIRGYLPVIRMSNGVLRYRASGIDEFLKEREHASNLRRKRR